MPDWADYIRRNLRLTGFRPERERDIVEDLAQQLNDVYRDALARGLSEADAVACAQQNIGDWKALASELQRSRRGAVRFPFCLFAPLPVSASTRACLASRCSSRACRVSCSALSRP